MARKLSSRKIICAVKDHEFQADDAARTSSRSFSERDPTTEEIAGLAHSLWEARQADGREGSAEDDWFHAERQLTRR